METTPARKTFYLREINTYKPVVTPAGFNRVWDVRLRLDGIAIRDLIVEFSWNEQLDKNSQLEIGATKTVTKAQVEVLQAGLGWSKLLPMPGTDNTVIRHWQHFIQFEKRFQISVPIIPIGGEALKALEIDNLHLIRLRGVLDTHTLKPSIELSSL